jgi:hypothetical protein
MKSTRDIEEYTEGHMLLNKRWKGEHLTEQQQRTWVSITVVCMTELKREKTSGRSNWFTQTNMCLFGAISMEGKQLFRQYDKFNGEPFLDFLKIIHHKFPKCRLFMDKVSPPHYRSKKVNNYLEQDKNTPLRVYLPTASPEFMIV